MTATTVALPDTETRTGLARRGERYPDVLAHRLRGAGACLIGIPAGRHDAPRMLEVLTQEGHA
jgi:hypothetical protein